MSVKSHKADSRILVYWVPKQRIMRQDSAQKTGGFASFAPEHVNKDRLDLTNRAHVRCA
jgi:hypothetical protein